MQKNDLSVPIIDNYNNEFKSNRSTENIIPAKNLKSINNEINKTTFPLHSLEFIALGRVDSSPKFTSTFSYNNAIKSTSNDLLKRNIFSINNSTYLEINKKPKQPTLKDQDITYNNYLKPLDAYKSFQKYSLTSNVINKRNYEIAKEKLFAKDINSSLKKGNCITKNDFIKEKLTAKKSKIQNNEKNIEKNEINENLKTKNNISSKNTNNDNEQKKTSLNFVDPNDYTKSGLKSNFLYFDKNNQQFLRHRNWWSVDG